MNRSGTSDVRSDPRRGRVYPPPTVVLPLKAVGDGPILRIGMQDSASLDDLDDAQLVAAIVAGLGTPVPEAEAALFRRYAPRVAAYGRRHLRHEDDAHELTQRVFLVVLEKVRSGGVRDPQRLGSFVLGTARHVAMGLSRQNHRQTTEPSEPQLAERPSDVPTFMPDPLATQRMAAALHELSERERTIIVLSFFQEYTAQEIAAALALREGNVRVIRHRALARLRKTIRPEDHEA